MNLDVEGNRTKVEGGEGDAGQRDERSSVGREGRRLERSAVEVRCGGDGEDEFVVQVRTEVGTIVRKLRRIREWADREEGRRKMWVGRR